MSAEPAPAVQRELEDALQLAISRAEGMAARLGDCEAGSEAGELFVILSSIQSRLASAREREGALREAISVKEKLPAKDGSYLVYAPRSFPKNSRWVVAEFYDDNNTFYSESSDSPMPDVTHWLPLPPEPALGQSEATP